jgi:hypothetical protein
VTPTAEQLERARDRLLTDDTYYSSNCLTIVDQNGQKRLLNPKPAQGRFLAVKARQEAEGKPVRIITLKARREGISTIVQGCMIKRGTQRKNHRGLVLAHDKTTSAEIFQMGETMYANLPDEEIAGLQLKPPVIGTRRGQEIRWGEPSRERRLAGHEGLNSSYYVDTANEYEGGRGRTFHSLHLSELAFYQAPEKKLMAILSTVGNLPGTMIVIESTASGYNLFRRLWVAAVSGNSDFYPLFIPWYEEPDYQIPFANDDDRQRFLQSVGQGEFGEEEPALVELGVTLEQLAWRRWAIVNRCHGDLRAFMQEYPATWEEAFLSTGRQVFAPSLVAKVIDRTERTDRACQKGVIRPKEFEASTYMGEPIKIPRKPFWVPEAEADVGIATPMWQRWEEPDVGDLTADPPRPPGQYTMFVDSSSGRDTATEGTDYFAIQIVNHRTLQQVATFHARGIDADLVAREAFLAAQLFGPEFLPWLAIEITGGYGLSIANKLWRFYRYPMLYFRRPAEQKREKQSERLGFSTDVKTKPLVVDHMKELLRTGHDGIRSKATASEMQTFVRDEKGKMGAEEDYFDDLIISYMGAQFIAHEKPLRRSKVAASGGRRKVARAPSLGVRPQSTYRKR